MAINYNMSGRKQFRKTMSLGTPSQNRNRKKKKTNTLEMMTKKVQTRRSRSLITNDDLYNIEDEKLTDNIKAMIQNELLLDFWKRRPPKRGERGFSRSRTIANNQEQNNSNNDSYHESLGGFNLPSNSEMELRIEEIKAKHGIKYIAPKHLQAIKAKSKRLIEHHIKLLTSNTRSSSSSCLKRFFKTCNRNTTWPRLKVFGSTVMTYSDMITDVLATIVIFQLTENIPSRQFWRFYCLAFIFMPSILHSYYMSFCLGWCNRPIYEKLQDFIWNISFLRPLYELVSSFRISAELEFDFDDKDSKETAKSLLNVTDDYKSESYLIFKVFETAVETFPQVFVNLMILGKLWDSWQENTKWELDLTDTQGSTQDSICKDANIFFISLGVSLLQAGITLEDLLERDVPSGVFPSIFSAILGHSEPLKQFFWILVVSLFFVLDLSARLMAWVPWSVILGFRLGFAFSLCFFLLMRFFFIYAILGHCLSQCKTDINVADNVETAQRKGPRLSQGTFEVRHANFGNLSQQVAEDQYKTVKSFRKKVDDIEDDMYVDDLGNALVFNNDADSDSSDNSEDTSDGESSSDAGDDGCGDSSEVKGNGKLEIGRSTLNPLHSDTTLKTGEFKGHGNGKIVAPIVDESSSSEDEPAPQISGTSSKKHAVSSKAKDSPSSSDDSKAPPVSSSLRAMVGTSKSERAMNLTRVDGKSSRARYRQNKRLRSKTKGQLCSFDVANLHALFAETLPWAILSIYVDLPLQMRWLRTDSKKDYIAGIEKSDEELKREKICFLRMNSLYRYRHSARYFLAIVLWSSVENIFMFSWSYTATNPSNPSFECIELTGNKLQTKMESDALCGVNTTTNTYLNTTFRQCSVVTWAQGIYEGSSTAEYSQFFSENLFDYITTQENRDAFYFLFVLTISLKFLVAMFLISVVWLDVGNNCCNTKKEEDIRPRTVSSMRRSIVVRKNQAIGRQLGHNRMKLVNEFRTTVRQEKNFKSFRKSSRERRPLNSSRKIIRKSITQTNIDVTSRNKLQNNEMKKISNRRTSFSHD